MIHELYDYSKKEHTGILTYDAGKIVAHSDTDPYITIDAKGCDIPIWVPEDFHRDVKFAGNKCILTGDPAAWKNWRRRRQKILRAVFRFTAPKDFIWKCASWRG